MKIRTMAAAAAAPAPDHMSYEIGLPLCRSPQPPRLLKSASIARRLPSKAKAKSAVAPFSARLPLPLSSLVSSLLRRATTKTVSAPKSTATYSYEKGLPLRGPFFCVRWRH